MIWIFGIENGINQSTFRYGSHIGVRPNFQYFGDFFLQFPNESAVITHYEISVVRITISLPYVDSLRKRSHITVPLDYRYSEGFDF